MRQIRRKIAEIISETENVPVMAENMIRVDRSPKEAIEAKLDECDCYIGIFHKRWGSIPRKDNPEFQIFWNGWERAATNIENDDQYERAIAPFVNDLRNADANIKSRFIVKLYDLIAARDEKISRRAMAMRQFLSS